MSEFKSRYAGVRPFETEQQLLFRGRQQDIDSLFRFIQLEQLVVLFGKSGTGKSSLLNAGIIPKIKAEGTLTPIRIRFKAWRKDATTIPPTETVRRLIHKKSDDSSTFITDLIDDDPSLWLSTKEFFIKNNGAKGLVMIFDQFEELFTYPTSQIKLFAEQLSEALFKSVPQRYWDVLHKAHGKGETIIGSSELRLLQQSPALKVVIAIRSDRLHLLNRLEEHLPSVLKNLYELLPLSKEGAESAMREPASLPKLDWFDTEPFLFSQEAVDYILDFLTHKKEEAILAEEEILGDKKPHNIETTQLQIICGVLEKKVEINGLNLIKVEHIGNLSSIIEQYYDDQIQTLNLGEQLGARKLIEEGLIFEEEERRVNLYEGQIIKNYKVNPETLRKLVNTYLLRSEPSLSGGFTYELSHDAMVQPILKAKRMRLALEHIRKEEQIAERKEKELYEAKQLAVRERLRRQRITLLALFAAFALLISLITARYAWAQTKIAKKATEEAETALYKALQEKRKRYDIQLNVNLRKLKAYKKAKEAPLIDSAQVKIQNIGQRIADLDRTIFQLKKKIKK